MKYLQSRRDFLKKTSAAAMATMGMGAPLAGLLSSCGTSTIPSTADSVILLFMAGGMAHTETFDPKKYTAFRKGMESKEVLSTFPSIPTKLDGIQFSEGLENIASVIHVTNIISTPATNRLSPSWCHIWEAGSPKKKALSIQ
jgi:hypothetical protein